MNEIINTDINSSKIIFGYFSLLSAKGWIPGSGEVVRCSFRLFKYPKQKEEEDYDDDDEQQETKTREDGQQINNNNITDPSDSDTDLEAIKDQEEEENLNIFAEYVGECRVDLCL